MNDTLWLTRKLMRTLFRNYKYWLLYIGIPIIGIGLSSLIYGSSGAPSPLNVGIVNLDSPQAEVTQHMIVFMQNLEGVQISAIEESEAGSGIASGRLNAVLIIPEGMAGELMRGRPAQVQLQSVEGSPNAAYIRAYLEPYLANIAAIGRTAPDAEAFDALYAGYREREFRVAAATVEDLSASLDTARQSIGYLIIIMLFAAVNLSGILLQDRENRTFYRIMSAPVSAKAYILANVIVNFTVMMLQIGVTLLVMTQLFRLDVGAPVWSLFLPLMLFALAAIGLSLMLVAFMNSSATASALQNLVILPSCLLAGCMFPLTFMPAAVRAAAEWLPQYWLLDAVGRLQQGSPLTSLHTHFLILPAFALAFTVMAVYRLRKSVEA